MAKLYPPSINGTIPAFCKNGTVLITVPFSMNKAVSKVEVGGFAVKIKTVSGIVKGVVKTSSSKNSSYDVEENYQAIFDVSHLDFSVGQYYKLQLAYIGTDGVVGYYSTVGVAKYTTMPSISVDGLQFGRINSHNYFYTGVYSQKNGDTTEKLYSARFRLYDSNKNVIQDTGDVLHNTSTDDFSYESHTAFSVPQDLEIDKTYYIKFSIKTVNGLERSTPYFRIMQRRSVSPEINAELIATLRPEEGYVNVQIRDKIDAVISGAFLLSRASSLNGYAWEELKRFDLQSMVPDKWSFLDCTVEQGATYKYSLQQYNSNGIYSDRIISNSVLVDFEDMFLFDGERQLNIRFNPKVSSFKADHLESKTDTIGSKYPFISRNGNVDYKEFSISGLISYQMDNVELFMSKQELGISEVSNNLTTENITAERVFKNKVLDWLNDGKPKIFRSPAEGNYIVRLMNVSLSPTDSLSRMLHTFTCQAYEIAEFTIENLKHYNLVDFNEDFALQTRWKTIVLKDVEDAATIPQLLPVPAYSIQFTEMMPGSKVYIGNEGESVVIGATGSYSASFPDKPIESVSFEFTKGMPGLFTYSYKSKSITVFGTIQDVSIEDVPIRQFIGEKYKGKTLIDKYGKDYTTDNIFEVLKDIKTEVLNAYNVKIYRRDVQTLYIDKVYDKDFSYSADEVTYKYYDNMYCTGKAIEFNQLDPSSIYYIRFKKGDTAVKYPNEGYYIEANNETFAPYTGWAIDGDDLSIFRVDNKIFEAEINDEVMSVADKDLPLVISNSDFITKLKINRGVIAELSYSKQIIKYTFEDTGSKKTIQAKKAYETAYRDVIKALDQGSSRGTIAAYRATMENKYLDFLRALNRDISNYKEANGILS